jgi:hypothetical protein
MSPTVRHALTWSLVLLALMGTLALYAQPDFMVNLADQVWACF